MDTDIALVTVDMVGRLRLVGLAWVAVAVAVVVVLGIRARAEEAKWR